MRRQKQDSMASAKWRELIEAQRSSGMSVAAYCREKSIADSHFYAWRKRLAEDSGALKEFVEVSRSDVSSVESIEINTPQGYRIKVPAGTVENDLKLVLAALVQGS